MMKKLWICCFAALCIILSGCARNQPETPKAEPPEQEEVHRETQGQETGDPPQGSDPAPEDEFTGRWQAVETPQYYMDIGIRDEESYDIKIVWAGASRGDIIWQVTGSYDETWEGVAYTGAKYEDVVNEDGTVDRTPVPEREEVTGLVYLEEDGTLHWIDDFDHAGDDMSFERE